MSEPYGIVLSKDVMLPMRDGIRLATDIYRPARGGDPTNGRYPTILVRTPYNKAERRYAEIADFFTPRGYVVVLQDMRDRYGSEASGDYFHVVTAHTGEDGYDTIEWVAQQSWSNGRVGMVGSSYAGITQVRAALERPPHLTAIWPDVVPTNSFHNAVREGGAMQLHMFWALFMHAQDAQDITDDETKQAEVWDGLTNLRHLFMATPWRRGQTALRHVPALEQTLIDYYTRGTYDEYWQRIEHDFTRYWERHSDIPGTFSSGWYDGFPHAVSEYFQAMTLQNVAPQRLVIGPWNHNGMRSDATYTHDVDFGPQSAWGVERYFDEQLDFFGRWLPENGKGQPQDEAPVRIFVMGGGTGRKTPQGKLDHGGRWRDEHEWPLSRALSTAYYLHTDGSLSTELPVSGAPLRFTFDPSRPVPTIGGLFCSIGELPPDDAGLDPAWARLITPVMRLRDLVTPGPADQKESPMFFGSREPYRRLSERPDVLVFQTDPLAEPIEVTGPVQVRLWISSSAVDTDFTAKLIDVHPANEDYPDGYDMLLTDSIIRCRYREGFEREVLMDPGVICQVTLQLPPTSNSFEAGHRIRVDVSSSNWPRLDVNPNTGEPLGRHTHELVAEQAVYADPEHPSQIVLPVIPG